MILQYQQMVSLSINDHRQILLLIIVYGFLDLQMNQLILMIQLVSKYNKNRKLTITNIRMSLNQDHCLVCEHLGQHKCQYTSHKKHRLINPISQDLSINLKKLNFNIQKTNPLISLQSLTNNISPQNKQSAYNSYKYNMRNQVQVKSPCKIEKIETVERSLIEKVLETTPDGRKYQYYKFTGRQNTIKPIQIIQNTNLITTNTTTKTIYQKCTPVDSLLNTNNATPMQSLSASNLTYAPFKQNKEQITKPQVNQTQYNVNETDYKVNETDYKVNETEYQKQKFPLILHYNYSTKYQQNLNQQAKSIINQQINLINKQSPIKLERSAQFIDTNYYKSSINKPLIQQSNYLLGVSADIMPSNNLNYKKYPQEESASSFIVKQQQNKRFQMDIGPFDQAFQQHDQNYPPNNHQLQNNIYKFKKAEPFISINHSINQNYQRKSKAQSLYNTASIYNATSTIISRAKRSSPQNSKNKYPAEQFPKAQARKLSGIKRISQIQGRYTTSRVTQSYPPHPLNVSYSTHNNPQLKFQTPQNSITHNEFLQRSIKNRVGQKTTNRIYSRNQINNFNYNGNVNQTQDKGNYGQIKGNIYYPIYPVYQVVYQLVNIIDKNKA